MIRFEIGGEYLELPKNLTLTFKKTNILFAFDKIECERSTSFDIPVTPINDKILLLGRWVQTTGQGMRRFYDAQMQDGLVVKNGYLYAERYTGKSYKAVFVTGELLGLKAIKNAGKVGDIFTPTDVTTFGNTQSPAIGRNSDFSGIAYKTDGSTFPSLRLYSLINRALSALGVSWSAPAVAQYIRIIPEEISGAKEAEVEFTGVGYNMSTSTYPVCYSIAISNLAGLTSIGTARVARTHTGGTTQTYHGLVQQFRVLQNISLTFPSDWDDNLFIGYFINGNSDLVTEFSFYGDRSFDEYGNITGESLRGRTIEIPYNTYFCIIDKSFYVNQDTSGGGHIKGWGPTDVECELVVEGGEVEPLVTVRMRDNMPDLTVTDLLKIYAALCGRQLYYTEQDGISFDTLDFDTWGVFDLTGKVIKEQELKRTFSDYARQNVIVFKQSEAVPESMRLRLAYTIDNDSLPEKKTLQEIGYSEGANAGAYGTRSLIYVPGGTGALADANTNASTMLRAELLKSGGVQTLCDESTEISIQADITSLEFDQLTPKTLLYYNGVRYVWTEATWSGGKATLKLSKISA